MKTLFVVTRIKGAAWDSTRPVRSQEQWSQHAEFMDGLAAHGFIVLGGPIGADEYFVHVVSATHEEQVRAAFALDPWSRSSTLATQEIRRWTILLESGQHG